VEGGRLGVDIGGTFTDVALEKCGRRYSAKILTTPEAPERAVLEAIGTVLRETALAPADLSIIIHGTTLATNAIIERKGAKTALLTTEGFRDTIEIRHENRFEQYDVNIDLPPPLPSSRSRSVFCTALPIRRMSAAPAKSSLTGSPGFQSPCRATFRPRCASTSASRRPAPTRMSSH